MLEQKLWNLLLQIYYPVTDFVKISENIDIQKRGVVNYRTEENNTNSVSTEFQGNFPMKDVSISKMLVIKAFDGIQSFVIQE